MVVPELHSWLAWRMSFPYSMLSPYMTWETSYHLTTLWDYSSSSWPARCHHSTLTVYSVIFSAMEMHSVFIEVVNSHEDIALPRCLEGQVPMSDSIVHVNSWTLTISGTWEGSVLGSLLCIGLILLLWFSLRCFRKLIYSPWSFLPFPSCASLPRSQVSLLAVLAGSHLFSLSSHYLLLLPSKGHYPSNRSLPLCHTLPLCRSSIPGVWYFRRDETCPSRSCITLVPFELFVLLKQDLPACIHVIFCLCLCGTRPESPLRQPLWLWQRGLRTQHLSSSQEQS